MCRLCYRGYESLWGCYGQRAFSGGSGGVLFGREVIFTSDFCSRRRDSRGDVVVHLKTVQICSLIGCHAQEGCSRHFGGESLLSQLQIPARFYSIQHSDFWGEIDNNSVHMNYSTFMLSTGRGWRYHCVVLDIAVPRSLNEHPCSHATRLGFNT